MEQIFEMISNYGLEAVVIALIVNLLTGLIKIPIKALTNKMKNGKKISRFIVFLPIILGFIVTFYNAKFLQDNFSFNREFSTQWLTASSLSLTFYAIYEKLFPSKKKTLSDCEIETSRAILNEIKQLISNNLQQPQEAQLEGSIESKIFMKANEKTNKIKLSGKQKSKTLTNNLTKD